MKIAQALKSTGTGTIKGGKVEGPEPGVMGIISGRKLDTGIDTSKVESEVIGDVPTVTVIPPADAGPRPAEPGSWPMSEERLEELKLQGQIKGWNPLMFAKDGRLIEQLPIEQGKKTKSKGLTIW